VVLCLSLLAVLAPLPARAQSESGSDGNPVLRNARQVLEIARAHAQRLGTSAGPDPDTVFVGKSYTDHTGPDNYWNLYVGTYRPGTNAANNALWDWDNSVGIQAPDSLHGWWPYEREYNSTGGLTLTDDNRPWWCLDYGNVGNYVISQQSSAKRTFGVIGYWHADGGRNQPGGSAVMWTPLAGSRSAWCGMRQYGDYSVQDQVTHNWFNGNAVAMYGEGGTTGGGTTKRLPGYLDQMDQMLYRDIPIADGNALTVSFLYRTRMSTDIGTAAATRSGWFHGDPLAVTAGNFISSSAAGASAPQDSFMVYVGSPVNDAGVKLSDGVIRPVYDKQRRWFSEVLRIFDGAPYYEIFQRAGNNPADTLAATPSSGPIVVPAAQVSSILNTSGNPGQVRLVFRVKTNRGFSDADAGASGYNSGARGAVQVDDVTIDNGAGPVVIGDFETPEQGGVNAIDNRFPLPPGLATTDVWRSTGKPPSVWFHVEPLSNLTYNDLCGPPNSPSRACNIGGNVVTPANHDMGEEMADSRYASMRETMSYNMSPSIAFIGGPGGTANSQGISSSIASASEDYILWYDLYAGMFNLSFTGMSWVFGQQTYPAIQSNGCKAWGNRQYPGFIIFNPEPQCFTDLEGYRDDGFPFRTSNPSGIPDSLHILIGVTSQCFRFNITLGCNSSQGGYFDNISLAFVDKPGLPGQASADNTVSLGAVSSDIWQFVNDTFPANETAGLPGTAAFDTTTGLIRTGLNNAQATGNALRLDIPGDSSSVVASNATVSAPDDPALANVRVDLVFRILPGPGNYQIAAGRSMPPGGSPSGVLLQVPTNQSAVVAPGDASFWGQYIADPGEVSAGDHHGHTSWDHLTWNSARMDSTELNIFPTAQVGNPVGSQFGSAWMSMYHELDPKFATLGVNKFKCFVVDTTKTATSSPTLDNVNCTGVVPAWLTTIPHSRTGYDGNAQTREFTKIIPDGLLTPGSHVAYFYRKSHAIDPFVRFAMCPDTNFITPQSREGSTDEHRWQEFSVLPDRWKNVAFGGAGSACMLYVDLNDRRGNEGRFVGVMDSLGMTAAAKWGAHNGWHAPGTTNLVNLDVRTDMLVAVSDKNSQPGTTWDMYGVKASESLTTSAGGIGNRLANRANMGFAAGREAKSGPTPDMLRAYYRMLAILSGDLNSGVLGPFVNRSQNDIALLNDYLTQSIGSAQPRGIFIQGDGFGQSEQASGGIDPAHTQFLTDKLGVVFRNPSYQSISGNVSPCVDLLTTTGLMRALDIYGVANACTWSNDVYTRNPAISEAAEGAFYENAGSSGPYVSDVVKPATALRNWIAVTSGYDIEHLLSRYCDTDNGRLAYYYYMLNKVFGGICQITGSPSVTLDTPQGGRAYADFMKIGNSVMKQGASIVRFGVAKAGRVQVNIYDVAGRKVRDLADRVFSAGEHALQWDGTDDAGGRVARGVYFVRSSVQKDTGRIIVLNN
jgi:hypothetical protein